VPNTRAKGFRSLHKALAYVKATMPGAEVIPFHQVSRFAQAQPFDCLVFQPNQSLLLVEVRSNQFRINVPQTQHLASLPGKWYRKQIWRFKNGESVPDIRTWDRITEVWADG